MAIDRTLIERLEGFEANGYVPSQNGEVIGNSGVTIANGLDLGQHTKEDLERIGIPKKLIELFSPYLGLKRDEAVRKLEKQPLSLSEEQAEIVRETVFDDLSRSAKNWYNSHSDTDWNSLSSQQQTVVSSILHQYGTSTTRGAPQTKQSMLEGDWGRVVELFQNWPDQTFQRRRTQELQHLVGADVDGIIGPQTEAAIQSFLEHGPDDSTPEPDQQEQGPISSFVDRATQASHGAIDTFLLALTDRIREQEKASEEQPQAATEQDDFTELERMALEALEQGAKVSSEPSENREANERRLEQEYLRATGKKQKFTPQEEEILEIMSSSGMFDSPKQEVTRDEPKTWADAQMRIF